jgi:hypothetical protein
MTRNIMKNFMRLCALGAMAVMIFGCKSKPTLKTEVFDKQLKVALADNCPDSLELKVKVEYPVQMVEMKALPKIEKLIVSTAFGKDYDSLKVDMAANKFIADETKEYRDENLEMWEKAKSEMGASFLNWYEYVTGTFGGSHGDVTSYLITHDMYQGGAHGSSEEIGLNFNSKTGEKVDEETFFIDDYKDDLPSLLRAHLREAMKDDDAYEALFVKDIEPNGNFTVSDNGVTYIYGQYEIGPYYLGIIHVTVPWEELANSGLIRGEQGSDGSGSGTEK